MSLPGIGFRSLVPPHGFCWVTRNLSGSWQLFEPPDDWPLEDYTLADSLWPGPDDSALSRKIFLAAYDDFFEFRAHEPELYLRFASEQFTPSEIMAIANKYGLLGWGHLEFVPLENAPILPGEAPLTRSNEAIFVTEPASVWIEAHKRIRRHLATIDASQNIDEYVTSYNEDMERSLSFGLHRKSDSEEFVSEVLAASMGASLDLNWGASLGAHALHRQCASCSKWFIVRAGSGRPEKVYCSDRCKMRAYRRRRAVKKFVVGTGS